MTVRKLWPLALALAACSGDATDSLGTTSFGIANGQLASGADHPYAAFLELTFDNGMSGRCTGTLIDPTHVLTAAHCAICASSATVYLLGDNPPNAPPGAPPITFQFVPDSGIHVHPEAYPDPIDCAWTGDMFDFILNTVHWDHDLAILELPQPSSVKPLPPLIVPSYGFSPVQDLHADGVTIVGRGLSSVNGSDTSLMRAGTGSLDRFVYLSAQECWPPTDQDNTEDFVLFMDNAAYGSPPGPAEATILSGDSGGPMRATVGGTPYVIGVASGGKDDKFSIHAPVFLTTNAGFIAGFIGGPAMTDLDGDDVLDYADNCSNDANTDQIDRDADGVGDVCDDCTGINELNGFELLTTYDGDPVNDYAQDHDPAQQNGNVEAEDELLLADGGSTAHLSYADYSRGLMSAFGSPCNAGSSLMYQQKKYRRGDVCDEVPHPRAEVMYEELPPSVINAPPMICDINGYGIATCGYYGPTGIAVTPVAEPDQAGTPGETGVRFCKCASDHATEAERRLYCGASTAADCGIDGARYEPVDPKWKRLHIAGGNGVTDPLTAMTFGPEPNPAQLVMPWHLLADMSAISGVIPQGPGPYDTQDGGIVGGPPAVPGILWSHVASYDGEALPHTPPADDVRVPDTLGSYYTTADLAIETRYKWHKFPLKRKPFPWEYCGRCGLEFPWLYQIDPGVFLAVGPETSIDVSDKIDASAFALIGSSETHVAASESAATLETRSTVMREAVVDSTTMTIVGRIGVRGGKVIGEQLGGGATFAITPPHGVLAYSGVLERVFDLGVRDPRSGTELWAWSADTTRWAPIALTGAALGTPETMTFRLHDTALYVIDRIDGASSRRLVRIDLVSGVVSVVAERFLDAATWSEVAIGNAGDDGLIVAATGRTGSALAELAPAGTRWQATARATWDRRLTGDVRAEPDGAISLTAVDDRFEPVWIDRDRFSAAGTATGIEPVL